MKNLFIIFSFIYSATGYCQAPDTVAINRVVAEIEGAPLLVQTNNLSSPDTGHSQHYITQSRFFASKNKQLAKYEISSVLKADVDVDSMMLLSHQMVFYYKNNKLIKAINHTILAKSENDIVTTFYYSDTDNTKQLAVCMPDLPDRHELYHWGKYYLKRFNKRTR